MKMQKLKCENVNGILTWTDRASGKSVFTFGMDGVNPNLRDRVYEYGLRQIIADAGADADSMADRVAKMTARTAGLIDGTWGTRATMPDGDIFRAAVAAGLIPDTVEARDKWRGLKADQRRAIGRREDVKPHLPAADGDATDDILSSF
jgi:hypothetical protein